MLSHRSLELPTCTPGKGNLILLMMYLCIADYPPGLANIKLCHLSWTKSGLAYAYIQHTLLPPVLNNILKAHTKIYPYLHPLDILNQSFKRFLDVWGMHSLSLMVVICNNFFLRPGPFYWLISFSLCILHINGSVQLHHEQCFAYKASLSFCSMH